MNNGKRDFKFQLLAVANLLDPKYHINFLRNSPRAIIAIAWPYGILVLGISL